MSYLSLYRPHHPANHFDQDHDLSIRQRRAARQAYDHSHSAYSGPRTPRARRLGDRHYYEEPPDHYLEDSYEDHAEHHHGTVAKIPEPQIPSGPLTTYIYSKCKHVEKCPSAKGGGGRFIKKGLCDNCISNQANRPRKKPSNVKLVRSEGGRLMYVREG